MPKPTLLQHIFNKPSQSYTLQTSSSPPVLDKRNFHSVKNEMTIIAAAAEPQTTLADTPEPDDDTPASRAGKEEDSGSSDDAFYTPNTSPRESFYGEPERAQEPLSVIPRSNIAVHILGRDAIQHVITNQPPKRPLPSPRQQPLASHSRSPSSASASISSSYSVASTSTAPTSPYSNSDKAWSRSLSPVSTRATTPVSSANVAFDDTRSLERRSSQGSTSRRKKGHSKSKSSDWSRDVRWLVPPSSGRRSRSSSVSSSSSSSSPQKPKVIRSSESDMLQTLSPTPIPEPSVSVSAPRRASTLKAPTARRTVGRRRMSAVWEEDEGDDSVKDMHQRRVHTGGLSGRALSLSTMPGQHHPPRMRAASLHTQGTSASASSNFTSSSKTVDIPNPLPVSDGGNPSGFTSLVLPRAAYTPSSNRRYTLMFGNVDKVDITRSGLAQTTMSTISITKNAASATLGSRHRFLSLSSLTIHLTGSSSTLKVTSTTPSHLLTDLPPPVSFTSYMTPPSKVQSHQVLVQIYAVGIDILDDLIVSEKSMRNDSYGFVAGRSFVGRAVECGFEVNRISKSDWVMGILDVRKCGALSEFIVVDKSRLVRCPRPSADLTMEQLALLPLCGVQAHRAVRTSDRLQHGARALVLQGQDGAGALAVQELTAYGVHVTAQIPPIVSPDKLKSELRQAETEERVKQWGAREVVTDSPVAAVNSLQEDQFDLVIDTIGGRRIWDACRRVLKSEGQFTTLVGESSKAVPSINAHFKSNMRSLRRAFVKKDHKAIGYAWVSPAADVDNDGEDIRDSLNVIGRLAVDGVLRPWVDSSRVVPFERAPTLFSHQIKENTMLSEGRTAVVRIID